MLPQLHEAATGIGTAAPELAADMEEPCGAETGLLDEPLQGLQGRLGQLLADWPDNPILTQLLALCARLAGEASACNCAHTPACWVQQRCAMLHGLVGASSECISSISSISKGCAYAGRPFFWACAAQSEAPACF